MGKRKNRNTEQQNQNQDENNNAGKDEIPNEPNAESNEKQSNKQNTGVIVLGIYLHCQGCVETVVKSLRGFEDIEEITPNFKDNRLTVKGKSVDPVRTAERVRRKTGKHVQIISPVPKKQQEKKAEKKPETPKVVETVLKIYLHCEGCAKEVKHCFLEMEGVQMVNVDMKASHVTVKGTCDPKNLITRFNKKTGRHAEIVNAKNKKNQNNPEKKEENEKKEKEKDEKNSGSAYPNFPPELVYAPQLFSDENPNACSIM